MAETTYVCLHYCINNVQDLLLTKNIQYLLTNNIHIYNVHFSYSSGQLMDGADQKRGRIVNGGKSKGGRGPTRVNNQTSRGVEKEILENGLLL